jgi:hypothetical protein
MKGLYVLLAFFTFFLAASLLIPVPMFPGSWFCNLIGNAVVDYVSILSAVFNGIFYGGILWLAFTVLGRKLAE